MWFFKLVIPFLSLLFVIMLVGKGKRASCVCLSFLQEVKRVSHSLKLVTPLFKVVSRGIMASYGCLSL